MAGFGDSLNLGAGGAIQSIKDAAGIVSSANSKYLTSTFPWDFSNIESTFFPAIDIDVTRWNQLFPYRLCVIDVTQNNNIVSGHVQYVGSTSSDGTRTTTTNNLSGHAITSSSGAGSVLISFTPMDTSWVFQLPISPQQLSITDQFAINTTATLRGILEEHNGIKFKMISASGTMGVWPYRESVTKPPTTPGIIQSVFGNTLQAVGSLVSSVQSVINAATSGHPANKPVTVLPQVSTAGPESTGYYNAMALQQFLEQYVEAKKDPAHASWRLVFDIPKQNTSYVVTPIQYVWQQNVNKPLEILYTMQLKGWRRVNLNGNVQPVTPSIQPISPGILQRILTVLSTARQVMSSSLSLLAAVRSDVETPLNVLRQTSLFVKDLAGVAITAADLPSQIAKDYKSSIAQSINNISTAFSSINTNPAAAAALAAVVAGTVAVEGISINAVSSGQLGQQTIINQTLNPAAVVLNNPDANFTLLDAVPVSTLTLTTAQQNTVNNLISVASQTSVATLKQYRATILGLALQLSNNFGAGSAYYDTTFNLPSPTSRTLPMTLDEYDILKSLYDMLSAYDILTASTTTDDANIQTAMDYVAGLAATAGIEFQTDTAKILVPVPYGKTIEAISLRYLGDIQRWLEIVTLNGLKEPYIDETGFQYPLLSNALGRQIVIGDDTNLYLGQTVILQGAGQFPAPRLITQISSLSSTSFLVTLDGLPNLNNFTLSAGSYLQAYLPGTVNSQQKIYIPSDLTPAPDSGIIPPPTTSGDPLTGLSKVDWLLTETGDIATTQYGDFRYSYGITNIIQALTIKFSTQIGKWLIHPEFGIGILPGTSIADIDIQQLYNNINSLITADPRFSGVTNLQIFQNGPSLSISLGVSIAGQTGVFPITFALT
jgi:hypothetical protein